MTLPNFFFEKKVYEQGFKLVAGIDEVGRGSLAGPVVAGCVVFDSHFYRRFANICENLKKNRIKINDSKKLTALQREISAKWIKKMALSYGIGKASVGEINIKGINKASYSAFRRSIREIQLKTGSRVDYVLIDAFMSHILLICPYLVKAW